MKRILHLINDATPTRGGAQKILELLRADEIAQGKESFSFSKFRQDNFQNRNNIIGGASWALNVILTALRLKPEHIVIHSRFYLPFVPLFKIAGFKTIFYAHANYKSGLYTFKIFKTTSYLAVSAAVRDNLIAAGVPTNKINLIKNPIIATSTAYPNYPSTSVNVSFVGGLHPWKGIANLLDYISTIETRLHLIIIGDGPLKKELLLKIATLPQNISVDMLGEVENPFTKLKNCNINIMPSIEEGFGLVAIESMYHGRILIHSDTPALEEVCRNDGLSFSFSHATPSSFKVALELAIKKSQTEIAPNTLTDRSERILQEYGLINFYNNYRTILNKN